MTFVSKNKLGFKAVPIHKRKEFGTAQFMSEKVTFWVAVLSIFAFVTGNMVGSMGPTVFYHAVFGSYDYSLIVYEGTVSPLPLVPKPDTWLKTYGGDYRTSNYDQAPKDILIPLPQYQTYAQRDLNDPVVKRIYAVDNCATYETGDSKDGSHGGHAGQDIIAPNRTPVASIANGYVEKVAEQKGGYGKYVMIRYPNVPDPKNPSKKTTLFGTYAHLSEQLTSEGVVVRKGEIIGLVGKTGNASTYHLHFQLEREDAPTHPYWSFTSKEASAAGLSFSAAIDSTLFHDKCEQYTVSPMQYVQANYPAIDTRIAKAESSVSSTQPKPVLTASQLRQQRLETRLVKRSVEQTRVVMLDQPVTTHTAAPVVPITQNASSTAVSSQASSVAAVPVVSGPKTFSSMDIQVPSTHSGREWVKVLVTLLDENGEAIKNPTFSPDLYLRTAYGQAEFRPSVLTPLDFKNGEAVVEMLPLGKQTIVIEMKPYGAMSKPVKFEE